VSARSLSTVGGRKAKLQSETQATGNPDDRLKPVTEDQGAEGTVSDVRNVIIIGGGPAGYTAALYSARANRSRS